MQVKISWEGGHNFVGYDKNTSSIGISPKTEKNMITPPNLLLMSLGSCTGLFIIPTAKSFGVKLEDFEIDLKGIKANNPSKLFDKIIIGINLIGDFDATLARKII